MQVSQLDLYTPTDVKLIRDKLLKEQQGKCKLSGISIIAEGRTAVLDHEHYHPEQFVRGVLEREINAYVGAVENAYKRHLSYWATIPLPELLKLIAIYLEASKHTPERVIRHPAWIRKLTTKFNKLNAQDQNAVLEKFIVTTGKNPAERKKLWNKVVKDKNFGYNLLSDYISQFI